MYAVSLGPGIPDGLQLDESLHGPQAPDAV